MNTDALINRITEGWGVRDVYPLEEDDLLQLLSQHGAKSSTTDNDDGTTTITVEIGGKKFICTKQTAST